MSMRKNKAMCWGCRNDFYNGHNPYDVKECWSFKEAKVVQRIMIHRDQPPPYLGRKSQTTLSCWYGDTGMRAVKPQSIGADGYWK